MAGKLLRSTAFTGSYGIMNRETKIGLVTGVTLIVLIGAMLSSYLSAPHSGVGDLSITGQGWQLRNQISSPVGIAQVPVPQNQPVAVAPAQPAAIQPANSGAASTPAAAPVYAYNQVTQLPYGSSQSSGNAVAAVTPVTNPPVTPVTVTPTPVTREVISIIPAQGVNSSTPGNEESHHGAGGAMVYVVKPGDTLGNIAWHFYHDGGPEAVARIVRANRGKLSSARAMIRVGEALKIPAVNEQSTATHGQLLSMDAQSSGNTYSGQTYVQKDSSSPSTAARTYRVQSGDTLYGIARKTMGAATEVNVHKIMVMNHIRDARTIFAGQDLKIPE
jgi:nucleoid-associated protein YgaU